MAPSNFHRFCIVSPNSCVPPNSVFRCLSSDPSGPRQKKKWNLGDFAGCQVSELIAHICMYQSSLRAQVGQLTPQGLCEDAKMASTMARIQNADKELAWRVGIPTDTNVQWNFGWAVSGVKVVFTVLCIVSGVCSSTGPGGMSCLTAL